MGADAITGTASRRGLLAAAAGAAAALAARTLGRPEQAGAADGNLVVLGTANDATSTTSITTQGASALALTSAGATALEAQSVSRAAVRGTSASGPGVSGVARVPGKAGVQGENTAPNGRGVAGKSPGAGVLGESLAGSGVVGASRDGIGVVARSARGTALQVEGAARFRSAGVSVMPAGEYRLRIRPNVPVASDSFVLATLNGPDPERLVGPASQPILLWFVERHPDEGAFDVVLTERVQHDVSIGWFVLA